MEERTGEAFELGEQLTVVGAQVQPGDQAPDYTLDYVNPEDGSAGAVSLADSAGRVRLLNVVNSLDTPVCHVETRNWGRLRSDLPADVQVYTRRMGPPYRPARCANPEGGRHPA